MTPSEAVQQAMKNHEFRTFRTELVAEGDGDWLGPLEGVVAVCWCGQFSPTFITEGAARDAHGRHRDRAALMRSFGQWDT